MMGTWPKILFFWRSQEVKQCKFAREIAKDRERDEGRHVITIEGKKPLRLPFGVKFGYCIGGICAVLDAALMFTLWIFGYILSKVVAPLILRVV
jgi:hypothetical protein